MSIVAGNKHSLGNMSFEIDMNNVEHSWKGKPTTNLIWNRNPRVDSSYVAYQPTANTTWLANHPNALQVYNQEGGSVTGYVNSGVTNWETTFHAHWILDEERGHPVVLQNDQDANWKAYNFGLFRTFTELGLSYGDPYTLSWDQWTTNTSKTAVSGIYGWNNTSTTRSFWDGQSSAGSKNVPNAFNTKTRTWQRVYCNYNVSTTWDLNQDVNIYMYGLYSPRGMLKMDNLQLEAGTRSRFSYANVRSSTQSILDTVTGNYATPVNLVYTNDDTFEFDGTSSYIELQNQAIPIYQSNYTIEAVIKRNVTGVQHCIIGDYQYDWFRMSVDASNKVTLRQISYDGATHYYPGVTSVDTIGTDYAHVVATFSKIGGMKVYINGIINNTNATATQAFSLNAANRGPKYIGKGELSSPGANTIWFDGQIPLLRGYTRDLTAAEVKSSFNSLKGRYGL